MKTKLITAIFALVGATLLAQQPPYLRNFFNTNANPIVDVVVGSNATVQASTPAANIRRFTVNGQVSFAYVDNATNGATAAATNSAKSYADSLLSGSALTNTVTYGDQYRTNSLTVAAAGTSITNTSAANQGALFGPTAATLSYGSANTLFVGTNVGIGTAGPVKPLEINFNVATSVVGYGELLRLEGDDGNTVGRVTELGFGLSGATYSAALIGAVVTSASGYNRKDLYFATRPGIGDTVPLVRMTITSGGNVGFGTTVPAATGHFTNTVLTTQPFRVDAGAVTSALVVHTNGNTGVGGKATPLEALDVNGSVAVSGTINATNLSRGSLVISNAATTQALSSTPGIITNWTRSHHLKNTTASLTAGTLTCANAGTCFVQFDVGVDTGGAADITFEVYLDSTATGIRKHINTTAVATTESAMAGDLLDIAAGQVLTVKGSCVGTEIITLYDCRLTMAEQPFGP